MKHRLISCAVMVLTACTPLACQDSGIGHTSVVMYDAARGNREIKVRVFYPSVTEGHNSPVAASPHRRFPVISFGHGYLLPTDTYKNIWEALVPEGFILVFPETEKDLFPSHEAFATDIGFALSGITRLGSDEGSMFYNTIDTVCFVMGHSMGGGAAISAAGMYPDIIDGIVVLAPYNTNPSAIQVITGITLPTLIITGSNDCITPYAEHPLPMYYGSPSNDKTLINIIGGNHCQMGGKNTLCRLGEFLSGCKTGISRDEQHNLLAKYFVPWLKHFMKCDTDAGLLFDTNLAADNAVEYLRSQTLSGERPIRK